MRKSRSLDQSYFEALYRDDADPWKFASSPYEQAKYDETVMALGEERAHRALEVGCSIGVLTRRLAAGCDHLVATDISELALQAARRRCADLSNVEFRQVSSAAASFEGAFDLIVLSEVIYYWDDRDLDAAATGLAHAIQPRGRVLMVHWLGETDYPKSADEAVEAFCARLEGRYDVQFSQRNADYRLDLWRWRGSA